MKKVIILLSSLGLMAAISTQTWAASEWTGNVNLTLGVKYLDDFDWEPVEDQGELGIHVDFRRQEWPLSMTVALLGSTDDDDINGIDVDGMTSEWRFGFKKIWEPHLILRPFFGGGVAIMTADLEAENAGLRISDDDIGFGIWISGGIYLTLNDRFNLGFDVGYSSGEVDLFGSDVDAGGGHAALLLGYHW